MTNDITTPIDSSASNTGTDKKGLTDTEKKWVLDILSRVYSGFASSSDMSSLMYLQQKDPEFYIQAQLTSVSFHPAFVHEQDIVSNVHRESLLRLRLNEGKYKNKLQSAQTDRLTAGNIAAWMKKAESGEKLGMLKPKVVGDSKVLDAEFKPVEKFKDGEVDEK